MVMGGVVAGPSASMQPVVSSIQSVAADADLPRSPNPLNMGGVAASWYRAAPQSIGELQAPSVPPSPSERSSKRRRPRPLAPFALWPILEEEVLILGATPAQRIHTFRICLIHHCIRVSAALLPACHE